MMPPNRMVEQVKGLHDKCGLRLVPTSRGGWVHEANGSVRCPPVVPLCIRCDGVGLVQCSDGNCLALFHPGCGSDCPCCRRSWCPTHSGPTGLCHACSSRPAGQHGHEESEMESQW